MLILAGAREKMVALLKEEMPQFLHQEALLKQFEDRAVLIAAAMIMDALATNTELEVAQRLVLSGSLISRVTRLEASSAAGDWLTHRDKILITTTQCLSTQGAPSP